MVSVFQHRGDFNSHRITMEIMHGGKGTSLSAIRSCEMDVIPSEALNMCKIPQLIIPYLLRDELEDLKSKS